MLNSKITPKKKPRGDFGLFATETISEGEVIWQPHPSDSNLFSLLSMEMIKALPDEEKRTFLHYCYQVDDDLFSGYTSMEDAHSDPANFMNHSCDPNAWYEGERLVARRIIKAGEEITYDYATDATDRDWDFLCTCGSPICRKSLRRDDWKRLKDRYGDHFISYINRKSK